MLFRSDEAAPGRGTGKQVGADAPPARVVVPPVVLPEILEIGVAFNGAYAISARYDGTNLEDVEPNQAFACGALLASLLGALYEVPKQSDLPVRWHRGAPAGGITWRGWIAERLARESYEPVRDWRAALGSRRDIDRLCDASAERIRDLVDACP